MSKAKRILAALCAVSMLFGNVFTAGPVYAAEVSDEQEIAENQDSVVVGEPEEPATEVQPQPEVKAEPEPAPVNEAPAPAADSAKEAPVPAAEPVKEESAPTAESVKEESAPAAETGKEESTTYPETEKEAPAPVTELVKEEPSSGTEPVKVESAPVEEEKTAQEETPKEAASSVEEKPTEAEVSPASSEAASQEKPSEEQESNTPADAAKPAQEEPANKEPVESEKPTESNTPAENNEQAASEKPAEEEKPVVSDESTEKDNPENADQPSEKDEPAENSVPAADTDTSASEEPDKEDKPVVEKTPTEAEASSENEITEKTEEPEHQEKLEEPKEPKEEESVQTKTIQLNSSVKANAEDEEVLSLNVPTTKKYGLTAASPKKFTLNIRKGSQAEKEYDSENKENETDHTLHLLLEEGDYLIHVSKGNADVTIRILSEKEYNKLIQPKNEVKQEEKPDQEIKETEEEQEAESKVEQEKQIPVTENDDEKQEEIPEEDKKDQEEPLEEQKDREAIEKEEIPEDTEGQPEETEDQSEETEDQQTEAEDESQTEEATSEKPAEETTASEESTEKPVEDVTEVPGEETIESLDAPQEEAEEEKTVETEETEEADQTEEPEDAAQTEDKPTEETPEGEEPVEEEPVDEDNTEEELPEEAPAEEEPVEEETTEEEITDEEPKEEEIVYLSADTFVSRGKDFTVTASFDDDVFPVGTEMQVREILPGSSEYIKLLKGTKANIEDDWTEVGSFQRFFDITFVNSGEEIEPEDFIDVRITFDKSVAVTEEEDLQVLHFDDNYNATQVNSGSIDGNSNQNTAEGVSFTSDSFSTYGVVVSKTATQTITARNGSAYTIKVEYGKNSDIPADAELHVNEIKEGDARYELYKEQAALAMNSEAVDFFGLYDIEIYKDGIQYQPSEEVQVSIRASKVLDAEQLQVVHFKEEVTESTENADTEVIDPIDVNNRTVVFSTDGFSVYALAYTVDFHYNGVDYSIPGESQILLSELIQKLNIMNGDALLNVADVAKIKFTDEHLVEVVEVSGLITIINQDGEKVDVDAGEKDFLLKSNTPFNSEERLTIMLIDGQIIEVGVTDAQELDDGIFLYRLNSNNYAIIVGLSSRNKSKDIIFKSETEEIEGLKYKVIGIQYISEEQNGYGYWVHDAGIENITFDNDENFAVGEYVLYDGGKNLVFTNKGVIALQKNAFNHSSIQSVRFENTGEIQFNGYSFAKCSNLQSVAFDNIGNITFKGSQDFSGCPVLKNITSNGTGKVNIYGQYTFYNCPELESVSFNNLPYLGYCTFYSNKPESVKLEP